MRASFLAFKNTLRLRLWAWLKVPMIHWTKPRVLQLDDQVVEIVLPLNRRTQNHLKSLYFGALACGADVAGGILALRISDELKMPVSFVFKSFKAEFLKRAEANTHFFCKDGAKIRALVHKAASSDQREEASVLVEAFCPSLNPNEPVARFELCLSLRKVRSFSR